MNKKIIGAILCIGILTMSAIPVMGAGDPSTEAITVRPLNYTERILKRVPVNASEVTYGLCTVGAKRSADIQLTAGNETEIAKIEKILGRKLIGSWIIPALRVKVTGLDFTVSYENDVGKRSRLAYFTEYGKANFNADGKFTNLTEVVENINTAHKITVTGFSGYFVPLRAQLFKIFPMFQKHRLFTPAEFMFVGFCENIVEE